MLDCKPLATPTMRNLKLSAHLDSDLVAPVYWQLIGSLMYLVNIRLDTCFEKNA